MTKLDFWMNIYWEAKENGDEPRAQAALDIALLQLSPGHKG